MIGTIKHYARPAFRRLLLSIEMRQDGRLNINTSGSLEHQVISNTDRNFYYEPTPYAALRKISKAVKLTSQDIICDLGCGKGRVLCWFARYPIKKCIGIDIDQELLRQSEINANQMAGRLAPIEIKLQDACEFDFTNVTILLMFNPFGPEVMKLVLKRLNDSIRQSPRPFKIVYINPRCLNLFAQYPEFRQTRKLNYLFNLLPSADIVIIENGGDTKISKT